MFRKKPKEQVNIVKKSKGWQVVKAARYGLCGLYIDHCGGSHWFQLQDGTYFDSKETAIRAYYLTIAEDKIRKLDEKELESHALSLD